MRFSIVTPSLNQAAYLGECLASVSTAADHAGITSEHIVIDGGSSDGTLDLLQKQPGIRWTSEPDNGQSAAINKGLRQATGDIISYLCADDTLEPDSLRQVAETFTRHPEVNFVYGDAWFLESDSGWKRRKKAGVFSDTRLRKKGNFLLQPAVFWRRSVMERFGLFNEDLHYCMDHEYWLRVSRYTRWQYLPQPLATCRLHDHAKTSRALAAAWKEAAAMQARYGILFRPRWEAFWMQTAGWRYYRMKRRLFAKLGRLRKS